MQIYLSGARHFWLVLLLGSLLNGYVLYKRAEARSHVKAQRASRWQVLMTTTLSCLPWVVAGLGVMIDTVPSFFHYFVRGAHSDFISLFHLSFLLAWLAGALHSFTGKRANKVEPLARWLILVGGILVLIMLWVIRLPASSLDWLLLTNGAS